MYSMNKKQSVVTSLVVIIASVLVTAVGVGAFFNAEKTISTNKFAAGILDLDVTASDNINQPISIDNVGGSGEIGGSRMWKIRNIGTLPGKLIFNLQNINNQENGCNAPEIEAEPNCETDSVGELGKVIIVKALIGETQVAQSTLENGHDFVYDKELILQPKEEKELTIDWGENPVGYGNEVQSDTVSFDMVFRLEQQ